MSANLIALQNKFLGKGETAYDLVSRLRETKGSVRAEDLAELAAQSGLPKAQLRAVAKFYDELREEEAPRHELQCCIGEACAAAGGKRCRSGVEADLAGVGGLRVSEVACLGYCGLGPNARLGDHVFSLGEESARAELASALAADREPELAEPVNAVHRSPDARADVLLRSFGAGVAEFDKARSLGAYRAFDQALEKGADWVLGEVEASMLRGRGGAGFPAGLKLRTARDAPSSDGDRYIVVNADEGDAGAYIDKELMEQDPHAVLEGMLLAAVATGASAGFFYLRAEYPRAWRVVEQAIRDARAAGYLGEGASFPFDVKLVRGHGAYICGEETSLLRSLEGVPAQVSPKPPYPAVEGYAGKPTVVNNVETLAALPWIVANGGARWAELGAGESRGTKLVSLNAAVAQPGLYEVELGITLRELVFERAGGMAAGKRFQAVQVGGPLGGIFPESLLDTKLSFEDMAEAGGLLGHAGVVVYDADVDLVEVGRGLMRFCAVESCGKCFPCRLGSVRGTEIFDKILEGRASQADLSLLRELAETMRIGSLCALGGAIGTPIENLLAWFPEAFARYLPGAEPPAAVLGDLAR